MSLVAAAVCPHPPLLVPAVGAGEPVAARGPSLAAVRRLAAVRPDSLVVVGDDPEALATGVCAYPSGSVGDFHGFGVDLRVTFGPAGTEPDPDAPPLPLSLAVAAWLLAEAGWTTPCRGIGVSAKTEPADAAALGAELADAAAAAGERTALLVMGDASARRTVKAPGALDERAGPYDEAVTRALAGMDLDALLALDPEPAAELLVAGRASWQVLAGAVAAAGGPAGWRSELLYADAPYGVGYLVCVWERGEGPG